MLLFILKTSRLSAAVASVAVTTILFQMLTCLRITSQFNSPVPFMTPYGAPLHLCGAPPRRLAQLNGAMVQ